MIKEILLLGNPELYEHSRPVSREELDSMKALMADLHDTMMDFRRVHRCGRAIAAPQIGVMKRVLYMNVDKPVLFINPRLEFPDGEQMEVLDDCMSFPGLLVKVDRYKRCRIIYKDLDWKDCVMELEGDLSELLQHEYDHLDGILATMRAKDNKALVLKTHAEREKHIKHLGTARLETDRLVLRPYTLQDAQAMYDNWAGDSQVTKYLTWESHRNVEETKQILEEWMARYEDRDFYNWAIAWKEDPGQPIGNISVVELDADVECASVGYCLGRKWWRQGVMTEAFGGIIRFLFEEVGLNRIQASHDIENPNSGKVMEKCGLKKEGVLRQSARNCQGICDSCIHGLLASDYFAQK